MDNGLGNGTILQPHEEPITSMEILPSGFNKTEPLCNIRIMSLQVGLHVTLRFIDFLRRLTRPWLHTETGYVSATHLDAQPLD
jgi:hypothetical protein